MFAEWGDPDGVPVFSLHGAPGSRFARFYDESVYLTWVFRRLRLAGTSGRRCGTRGSRPRLLYSWARSRLPTLRPAQAGSDHSSRPRRLPTRRRKDWHAPREDDDDRRRLPRRDLRDGLQPDTRALMIRGRHRRDEHSRGVARIVGGHARCGIGPSQPRRGGDVKRARRRRSDVPDRDRDPGLPARQPRDRARACSRRAASPRTGRPLLLARQRRRHRTRVRA
jgi:hypothetical protein